MSQIVSFARPTSFMLMSVFLCFGQTSSSLLKTDPKTQYYLVKKVLQSYYPPNLSATPASYADTFGNYELVTCDGEDRYLWDFESPIQGEELVGELADLAGKIVGWRTDLKGMGYPESVWRPLLVEFEDARLDLLVKGGRSRSYEVIEKKLAEALNSYRLTQHEPRPKIVLEPECGAGEMQIRIATRPSGGNVSLIPRFFYDFCKAQKIDADNPNKCHPWWHEVGISEFVPVSGGYVYRVTWADGSSKQGNIDVTNLKSDTITLQK